MKQKSIKTESSRKKSVLNVCSVYGGAGQFVRQGPRSPAAGEGNELGWPKTSSHWTKQFQLRLSLELIIILNSTLTCTVPLALSGSVNGPSAQLRNTGGFLLFLGLQQGPRTSRVLGFEGETGVVIPSFCFTETKAASTGRLFNVDFDIVKLSATSKRLSTCHLWPGVPGIVWTQLGRGSLSPTGLLWDSSVHQDVSYCWVNICLLLTPVL